MSVTVLKKRAEKKKNVWQKIPGRKSSCGNFGIAERTPGENRIRPGEDQGYAPL